MCRQQVGIITLFLRWDARLCSVRLAATTTHPEIVKKAAEPSASSFPACAPFGIFFFLCGCWLLLDEDAVTGTMPFWFQNFYSKNVATGGPLHFYRP